MGVPDFQSFFYPILKYSSDGQEHSLDEIRVFLTHNFNAINQHFLFQSLFKCKIYNFLS